MSSKAPLPELNPTPSPMLAPEEEQPGLHGRVGMEVAIDGNSNVSVFISILINKAVSAP